MFCFSFSSKAQILNKSLYPASDMNSARQSCKKKKWKKKKKRKKKKTTSCIYYCCPHNHTLFLKSFLQCSSCGFFLFFSIHNIITSAHPEENVFRNWSDGCVLIFFLSLSFRTAASEKSSWSQITSSIHKIPGRYSKYPSPPPGSSCHSPPIPSHKQRSPCSQTCRGVLNICPDRTQTTCAQQKTPVYLK